MSFIVLGVNHKTAPVVLREKLAFDDARTRLAYDDILSASTSQATPSQVHTKLAVRSLVILSTCNRTEVYCLAETAEPVLAWLAACCRLSVNELRPHIYAYADTEALTHVIRVASGLDSMILGEPQIFGQFKSAVALSHMHFQTHGVVNKQLNWLFEQVIIATKRVRTDTRIGEQAVTLGFAVCKLAQQIFDDLAQTTLVLVATGEMNQLVARHMCQAGVGKVVLCNRSIESAQTFADALAQDYAVSTQVVPFAQLADALRQGDVVSSSTGSLDIVIPFKMVKKVVKQRRYDPMLMVDLAVPRDIEEKVTKLDSVYHYAIDDLQHVIDGNKQQRQEASVNAEVLVSQLVMDIQARQRVKEASRDIAAYQTLTQDMSQLVQQKALQQLAQGKPAEQVVQEMAYQLTAKLTHGQFRLLRDAASQSDGAMMQFVLAHLLSQEPQEQLIKKQNLNDTEGYE